MADNIEQLRRAIDAARADGKEEVAAKLEDRLATAEGVRPADRSVPPHMDQDPVEMPALAQPQERAEPEMIGGLPAPRGMEEEAPALSQGPMRKPSAERPWSREEYDEAGRRYMERERELAQTQFEADQQLIRDGNIPTGREMTEFFQEDPERGKHGWSMVNNMGQQLLKDPETGQVRWAAMSPAQMDRVDKQGETTRAVVGALGFGTVRPGANIMQGVDADIEQINSFQRYLVRQLPEPEVSRIQQKANERYGEDSKYAKDLGLIPASTMREWIMENPENDDLLDSAAGDEWWAERRHFYKGAFQRLGALTSPWYGMDDLDPITGPESYQFATYKEGEQKPWYPGASQDVDKWRSEADRGPGIYEHIVKPFLTTEEGVMPGDRMMEVAEGIIEKTYTEEQQLERQMPFLSPEVEIENVWDLFDIDVWTHPDTKLPWNNMEAFALTFFESAPEMGVSIGVTRGAGGMGARAATGQISSRGMTLEQLDKQRRRYAGVSGGVAGSATEGFFVANAIESEVRNTLNEVPMEKYREDPLFIQLVEAGMTEAEAKQLLVHEAANIASKTGFVSTAMLSGPISFFIGKAGAGRLLKDRATGRWAFGTTGEMVTEGTQGLGEQLATEMGVARIDPDNPIFEDPNRYAEAFFGEAMVAGPIGALAAIEPSQPAGIPKEQVEAARATAAYMQATNERFKYETQLTDPEYINHTSPFQRLQDLERLESMQKREAETLLKAAPKMRQHLESQPTSVAKTEIQMLNRLEMRANAMLTDIEVARSQRTNAASLQQAEREVLTERAELQRRVNENIIQLDDINRLAGSIEAVQNMEAISGEAEAELVRDGYAKRTQEGNLVILPKGKRATKELNRQARGLQKKLDEGYTGTERRDPVNQVRRDMIESAGPVEREQMLYQDSLTGTQNRRAFNERQENIDVKEGQTPREVTGAQPAVAAVDVDSLGWVNDNMSHSAGDRLLVTVADALNAQKGVEVFRLGGDEFVVTGESEAALEDALQQAASTMAENEIVSGEDAVTPTITWGKGPTYEAADTQAIQMKEDRQQRGVVAKSKKQQPPSYRDVKQQGLFQRTPAPFFRDEGALAHSWQGVKNVVERGDSIEILTPDGAVQGVVTEVTKKRGRPRVTVNLQGRQFRFNPDNNHLITANTDPADIAWLTGDAEYAQPDRPTIPQVIGDVMIGHIGKGGQWYADLGLAYDYVVTPPWWMDDAAWNTTGPWDSKVFGMRPLPVASEQEMIVARGIKNELTDGYNNLPDIHLVESWDKLEKDAPDIVAQIRAEGGSATGVRGYFDHIGHTGIYIFVPNINAIVGSEGFKQGIAETVMHEMIGHYGVRGFFGDELDLRMWMHDTVDMFPQMARMMAGRLGLNPADPADKQLLGEEMIAYVAGEVYSGKVDLTPKQRNFWQRFVDWVKGVIKKRGWDKWAPLRKVDYSTVMQGTKSEFWNSKRISELISRSQDFVRNGKGFEFRALNKSTLLAQRDGDIFQSGVVTAINTGTRKLSRNERNQMKGKYGGDINNVPKEVALFPDDGSPNAYKQAVIAAQKQGFMTKRDLEMSGLSDDADFNLFRDASYKTLQRYIEQMNGGKKVPRWYAGVLPGNLVQELDDIEAAMERNYMAGPLMEFQADPRNRPRINETSAELMRARIDEILDTKIDPKKTRMSKELLLAHMASENVFRVFVEPSKGYPALSYEQAAERVLGPEYDINAITEEQAELIKAEQDASQLRGYDIGYDEQQKRWVDGARHTTEYSEWSPQGSRYNSDYRVALVKTSGRGGEMSGGSHWSSQNLMHIRTGIAQLLEGVEIEGMNWPNEAMKGKLLSLIELQSDWLQAARKGYADRNERDDADATHGQHRKTLMTAADQLGAAIGEDMWSVFHDQMRPILNLPSDGRGDRRGTLMEPMRNYTRETLGQTWEDITDDQRQQIWKDFQTQETTKLIDGWVENLTAIDEIIAKMPKATDLPGKVDVRAFETMDAYSARRVLNKMKDEITYLIDRMRNTLPYANNQTELVENTRVIQNKLSRSMANLGGDSNDSAILRLPMTPYMLQPILEQVYDKMGADKSRIAPMMDNLTTREQATVRIPIQVLNDLNTAMESTFTPNHLLEEMLNGARVSRHSDIPPGRLLFNVRDAGDNFMDVALIGDKGTIEQAKELVPKLISTWIDNHAQEKLDIQRRAAEEEDNDSPLKDADNYSYEDMVDFVGLEEADTHEGDSMTRDYSVQTYMQYEEDQISEIESELIDEAFENITEDEWNTLDDDHPGVGREGTTYRENLVIDDDGDVDNDDAEDALREARDEYRRDVLWEDEDIRMQAYEQIREKWEDEGATFLAVGSLPVMWDEDGDPIDYVNVNIIGQEVGDSYNVNVDGEQYDYNYDIESSKEVLADAIHHHYEYNGIVPPAGVPFGPDPEVQRARERAAEERLRARETQVKPNWEIAKGNIVDTIAMMSDKPQKLDKVFEELVTIEKKLGASIVKQSPLGKDELWRPIALKYLIADAVRRGLGGVMWNNGLSSATRGGSRSVGLDPTEQITWEKQVMTIRGQEQEVYVISDDNMTKPLVLAKNRLVPVIGASATRILFAQDAGKMPSGEVKKAGTEELGDPRDNYIVAPTGDDHLAVYRRSDNEFLGFVRDGDTDALQAKIQDDLQHWGASQIPDRPVESGEVLREGLGRVVSKGVITSQQHGGKMYVAGRTRMRGYSHTFSQPKQASWRQSYEEITPRLWNKELKKYGVQIQSTFVKVQDTFKAAEEEGQPGRVEIDRDEQIAQDHGSLFIAETEGARHDWVVMSQTQGPVVNDVFHSREAAQNRLDQYIRENYGTTQEGVEVFYFPITDEMREEYSGPVAPFHYDPSEDPALKEAAGKFGYQPTSMRDRVKSWRQAAGAEMRQGMVDQFYGLKRALNQAHAGDGAYISARLTTSLDSMMKAVLFHGNPIWSEGIVQTEGRGLMEILNPILSDPDTWGMYMAGKRAKGLLMEGWDSLTPQEQEAMSSAAEAFPGKDTAERVFNMMAHVERGAETYQRPLANGTVNGVDLATLDNELRRAWTDPQTGRVLTPLTHAERDRTRGKDKPRRAKKPGPSFSQPKQIGKRKYSDVPTSPPPVWAAIEAEAKANGVKITKAWRAEMAQEIDKLIEQQREFDKQSSIDETRAFNAAMVEQITEKMIQNGREHLFTPSEIDSMVRLGDKFSHFERVAKDYAEFNRKLLDFAEASGIIDPETRPMWESADYVPFYRADDDRLAGSSMSPTSGIANQRAPIRRLRGGEQNVGDILGNIMMNVTKLVDASVKNNAALESIDALKGSGIVSRKPLDYKAAIIPMGQLKKVLIDRGVVVPDDQPGIHMSDIPKEALEGFQKMFAVTPPEGPGILSVMRDGKREYYQTDDMLLWRSMASINRKNFGNWINLFRAPKRLLTTLITIDPSFMVANFIRDTGSAFVIGRDKGNVPVLSAAKGFNQALFESEEMRTLLGAGAAFESGYVTGGDPEQVKRIVAEAMKDRGFAATVLNSPRKLLRAWMHLGSSIENSNRMAIYNAAIRNGKSKKRAAYEAKDLMDFSMHGDWPAINFLIQTVPFMNARLQGLYRLGRGAVENPVNFTLKGMLVGLAGMAVYLMFKDDERYKELPVWDRHSYFHFWIGDQHYRIPKPFEVGAIFNTIPEMAMNAANSEETDAGKVLMREFGHMLSETFSMNPIPQTLAPMVESGINYNFFKDSPIVSHYEQQRLPPDQYRYRTSPFFIELAQRLPSGLDTVSGKIRSPLHLQNLYAGYTGTIGRYMLQAADAATIRALDHPLPPSYELQDYPVVGRFSRGSDPTRMTKYEGEVYDLLDKTTAIQGSLNFHEKFGNVDQYLETHEEYAPYIRAAGPLEDVRENIQDVNRAIQQIYLDEEMEPDEKTKQINTLEETRNTLFKEAWKLRPGGEYNPLDAEPVTMNQVIDMIDQWGVDNSTAYMRSIQENAPDTAELLDMIDSTMSERQLQALARNGE